MKVAFLGPSLPASEARGFTVLPPARQGDVWRALKRLRPRAIALIDGVFESQPSVWQHEILDALDAGVAVFGGASMGALRAAELHGSGMIGVGRIFRWYRDGELVDDADVALLHGDAEHGYLPLTVPHVNVRWAAQEALRAKLLRPSEAQALVERSLATFYQERTWPLLLAALPQVAREKWKRWRVPDLKADDAREVLRAASLAKSGRAPGARQPPPSSLVRMRRALAGTDALALLWRRDDARALSDAGLRRALLAAWAREQGLQPSAAEVRSMEVSWQKALRESGLDADEILRLCEELALERLVLDNAARMVDDGPSADEALLAEARLRGLISQRRRAPDGRRARDTAARPSRRSRAKRPRARR